MKYGPNIISKATSYIQIFKDFQLSVLPLKESEKYSFKDAMISRISSKDIISKRRKNSNILSRLIVSKSLLSYKETIIVIEKILDSEYDIKGKLSYSKIRRILSNRKRTKDKPLRH